MRLFCLAVPLSLLLFAAVRRALADTTITPTTLTIERRGPSGSSRKAIPCGGRCPLLRRRVTLTRRSGPPTRGGVLYTSWKKSSNPKLLLRGAWGCLFHFGKRFDWRFRIRATGRPVQSLEATAGSMPASRQQPPPVSRRGLSRRSLRERCGNPGSRPPNFGSFCPPLPPAFVEQFLGQVATSEHSPAIGDGILHVYRPEKGGKPVPLLLYAF